MFSVHSHCQQVCPLTLSASVYCVCIAYSAQGENGFHLFLMRKGHLGCDSDLTFEGQTSVVDSGLVFMVWLAA